MFYTLLTIINFSITIFYYFSIKIKKTKNLKEMQLTNYDE